MKIKVITLNCWGILVAKNHRTRLAAIVDDLVKGNYDVICLQEIFCKYQIKLIESKFCAPCWFVHHFSSGMVGSGLVIISRFPSRNTFFVAYPDRGTPFDAGGDWYAGKGIAVCRIIHPEQDFVIVNTHVHASYKYAPNVGIRTVQLLYLSQIINSFTFDEVPIVVTGDFNTLSDEPSFEYLLRKCKLIDSFKFNNTQDFYTCNNIGSTYSGSNIPIRIDYILFNQGFRCLDYHHSFCYCPRIDQNYSDHNAVEVVFELQSDKGALVPNGHEQKYDNIDELLIAKLHDILKKEGKQVDFPTLYWFILIFVFGCFLASFIYHLLDNVSFLFPVFGGFIWMIWLIFIVTYYIISRQRIRLYHRMIKDII